MSLTMKKRFRRTLLLFIGILFCIVASLHTRVVLFGILILLIQQEQLVKDYLNIKKKWVVFATLILYILVFPNRSFDKEDEYQSVYFNASGETVRMPWVPYLGSIISEEDGQSLAVFLMHILPESIVKIMVQEGLGLPFGSALRDIVTYSNQESLWSNYLFHNAAPTSVMPSNLYFQMMQDLGKYKEISHYFIHLPKDKNLEECEVTVFCHGFLGNWLLYPKLFSEFSDHIVICVETKGLNGIFTPSSMKHIYAKVLPHAFNRIGITPKKTHLVGLSNGCSAINAAIPSLPTQFKSYSILSGGLHSSPRKYQKVNIIYGAKDRSGGVATSIPKNRYKRYIIKGENHMLLISKPDAVFSILP